jgi:deoxyribodipyrimidine photo-lyase
MENTLRLDVVADQPVNRDGDFVLYWITANRRLQWNFALDRALHWSHELGKPLLVLEALRLGYRWASDRLHQFILDGMRDNAAYAAAHGVNYYPYVETEMDGGKGLLEALAARATVVVTDDFPCFFLPRMIAAAAKQVPCRMEKVDANGLLPMRAANQVYPTAYAFRRFLQKELPNHLEDRPRPEPWRSYTQGKVDVPKSVLERWPAATTDVLNGGHDFLGTLPIDHDVTITNTAGGASAAKETMRTFLEDRLPRYAEDRNDPGEKATSQLSPYLHFGHLSVHQIFAELIRPEEWTISDLAPKGNGSREGWWGMSPPAESFLDELITWRELGYNFCHQRRDYEKYSSLPDWARATLEVHASDKREHMYSLAEFENAATHDELWNAAQRELVREGRIHNYLRMLWGKKILEWTASPEQALEVMIELNNKYALDGRNPNSYSGIFWILGRYDRPWGPERKIFGKIRYMSSANTARKVHVDDYLAKYGA